MYPLDRYPYLKHTESDTVRYRRKQSIMTATKTQQGGTCWAFASTAAMESAIAREVHIKSAAHCGGECTPLKLAGMPPLFRKLRDKVLNMVTFGGKTFAIHKSGVGYESWDEFPQKDLYYSDTFGELMHTTNWKDQLDWASDGCPNTIDAFEKGVSFVRVQEAEITSRPLRRDSNLEHLYGCGRKGGLDAEKTTFTSQEVTECMGKIITGLDWQLIPASNFESYGGSQLISDRYNHLALIFFLGGFYKSLASKPMSLLGSNIDPDLYKDLLPNLAHELPEPETRMGIEYSLSKDLLTYANVEFVMDSAASQAYNPLAGDSSSNVASLTAETAAQNGQAQGQGQGNVPAKIYSNSFLCLSNYSVYYQIHVGADFDLKWPESRGVAPELGNQDNPGRLSLYDQVVKNIQLSRTMARPDENLIIPMPEYMKKHLYDNILNAPFPFGEKDMGQRVDDLKQEIGNQLVDTWKHISYVFLLKEATKKERDFWNKHAPLLQENGAHNHNGFYYELPLAFLAHDGAETSCFEPKPATKVALQKDSYVEIINRWYFKVTRVSGGAGGLNKVLNFFYHGTNCHLPDHCSFPLPINYRAFKALRMPASTTMAESYLGNKMSKCYHKRGMGSSSSLPCEFQAEGPALKTINVNTLLTNFADGELVQGIGMSTPVSVPNNLNELAGDYVYFTTTTHYEPWPLQKMADYGVSEWQPVLCSVKGTTWGSSCVITQEERERRTNDEEPQSVCMDDVLGGTGGGSMDAYLVWDRFNGVLFHGDWVMSRTGNTKSKVKYYDAVEASNGGVEYPFVPHGMLYETCSDHGLVDNRGGKGVVPFPTPKVKWYYKWQMVPFHEEPKNQCQKSWSSSSMTSQSQGGGDVTSNSVKGMQLMGNMYLTCVSTLEADPVANRFTSFRTLMRKALWFFGELSVPVVWMNEFGPLGGDLFYDLVTAKKVVTEDAFKKLHKRERRFMGYPSASDMTAWAPETVGLVWIRYSPDNGNCDRTGENSLPTALDPDTKTRIIDSFRRDRVLCDLHKTPEDGEVSEPFPMDFTFYVQKIQKPIFDRASDFELRFIHKNSYFKEQLGPNRICCYNAGRLNMVNKKVQGVTSRVPGLPKHNHEITIVGYKIARGKMPEYWILRNSHGRNWGDNGFAYIEAGKNMFRLEEEFNAFDADLSDFDLPVPDVATPTPPSGDAPAMGISGPAVVIPKPPCDDDLPLLT